MGYEFLRSFRSKVLQSGLRGRGCRSMFGKLSPIPAAMPPVSRHSLRFVIDELPGKADPFRTSKGKAQESVAHKKKIATIAGQIPDFRLYNFKY